MSANKFDYGDVAEHMQRGAAALHRNNPIPAAREVEMLRSMNAQLLRQIALLKRREAEAQQLADRDGLTGLFNRRRMRELLDSLVGDGPLQQHRVALLFVDLDGFKRINDDYGHAVGDKVLVSMASRLAARARTGDFVCRYGGDEFVVILPKVADIAAAHRVAQSIRKRIATPFRIDGIELCLTAAVGVSIYPDQAASVAALLQTADESMYRAKTHWTDPVEEFRNSQTPTRRRDDKSRRRTGT